MKICDIYILQIVDHESIFDLSSFFYYFLCLSQFLEAGFNVLSVLRICVNLAAISIVPSDYLRESSVVLVLGFLEKGYCSASSPIAKIVYSPFDVVVWGVVRVAIGF